MIRKDFTRKPLAASDSTDPALYSLGGDSQKIIVVDEDSAFLTLVEAEISRLFGSDSVCCTTNPQVGWTWLSAEAPLVLMTDTQMSELAGLQLVAQARAIWPELPIINASEPPRHPLARLVMDSLYTFMPKPIDFDQLSWTLRQLMAKESLPGFCGSTPAVHLADVVQLFTASPYRGYLSIKNQENQLEGTIAVQEGRVMAAWCGEQAGRNAFFEMASWGHAHFTWKALEPRTALDFSSHALIGVPAPDLLMSAHRHYELSPTPVPNS